MPRLDMLAIRRDVEARTGRSPDALMLGQIMTELTETEGCDLTDHGFHTIDGHNGALIAADYWKESK